MTTSCVALIPARMESTRFPGKPLAPINGVPMVIRCAQNSLNAGLDTFICTDSQLICDAANSYSIKSLLTPSFNTGTDRVNWAASRLNYSHVINLQGDEPLLSSTALSFFAEDTLRISNPDVILNGLSTLSPNYAFDPNNVKAILRDNSDIVYLSRKPVRNSSSSPIYIKQLGLYGMKVETLNSFSQLPQSRLELVESVEMLRWLEAKNQLCGTVLDTPSISVDTPEDLADVEKAFD